MKRFVWLLAVFLFSGNVSASSTISSGSSTEASLLLIGLLAPFVASVVIWFFYDYLKDYAAYVGASSGLISFTCILYLLGSSFVVSFSWIPSLGISFEFLVDGLSLMLGLLASGIGVLVFLYSRSYMAHGEWKRKYYTVLTWFMGSMIGLVFSSNLIVLFLFWEFTSVCSFLLISHSQRTLSGIRASKKSLIVTVASGLMLLLGFILLGNALGTYSIVEMLPMQNVVQTLSSQGLYIPILVLLGLGAGAKSAQVPLHIWLPDAMEAPTPVSAFLHSATMVKAGVFLIGRFRPILVDGLMWDIFFVGLGLTTMCVCAFLAVMASELKELLAYSTASHLGLIVAGFGFSGVLGGETGVFHIFNHAVFKASLFMVAGVVLHETGTQKIKDLSGLRHDWPVLGVVATVSGLSMAGIPLLNGFYSKELLYETTYHFANHVGGYAWFLPVIAVSGSVLTLIYSLRFISVFYGEKSVEQPSLDRLLVFPPTVLGSVAVLAGLYPSLFTDNVVSSALSSVSAEAHSISVHVLPGLTPAFGMSVLTVAAGLVGFRKRELIQQKGRRALDISYLSANYYYQSFLEFSTRFSDFVADNIETGLLRTYIIWVLFVASVTGIFSYLVVVGLPSVSFSASLPVAIVLATSIASVYAVIRSETYISSVLTLSILGFMVSIFYLLMDAPDLVMTQLVVESLSLIIFLLVLNKIPDYTKKVSFSRKYRDILISGLAGFMVFSSVVYSTMSETPDKLSSYYIENALPGSGGTNVVNVILVDFRGLDTMGEISVIVMAGLAILMLFNMRGGKE